MADELPQRVRGSLRSSAPEAAAFLEEIEAAGVSAKLIPARIGDYNVDGMKRDGWRVFLIWGPPPDERVDGEGDTEEDALWHALERYKDRLAISEGIELGRLDIAPLAANDGPADGEANRQEDA